MSTDPQTSPPPQSVHHPTLSHRQTLQTLPDASVAPPPSAPPPSVPITTHIHPTPLSTLEPLLSANLPHTLPLLRRIQFHLQTPASYCIATFPPAVATTSPTTTTIAEPNTPSLSYPSTYAIAFVDRSRAPETECWLYSSVERRTNERTNSSGGGGDVLLGASPPSSKEEEQQDARAQLLAVLEHIRYLGVPPGFRAEGEGKVMLVGALHRACVSALKGSGVREGEGREVVSDEEGRKGAVESYLDKEGAKKEWEGEGSMGEEGGKGEGAVVQNRVFARHSIPYVKFIFGSRDGVGVTEFGVGEGRFRVGSGEDVTKGRDGLPEGMRWTRVRREELALVVSRTGIPRTERTLEVLPGLGIRLEGGEGEVVPGRLIAWGFLGVDASLTSLHVEEEFRGKGLAKLMTTRVFKLLYNDENNKDFRLPEEYMDETLPTGISHPHRAFRKMGGVLDYHHSDVSRENKASIGVAKALGGVPLWDCFWALVDLDAVHKTIEFE